MYLLAQSVVHPIGDLVLIPAGSDNILLYCGDYEIFSTFNFFLPLIQEGQLLVSGVRMCKSTG